MLPRGLGTLLPRAPMDRMAEQAGGEPGAPGTPGATCRMRRTTYVRTYVRRYVRTYARASGTYVRMHMRSYVGGLGEQKEVAQVGTLLTMSHAWSGTRKTEAHMYVRKLADSQLASFPG